MTVKEYLHIFKRFFISFLICLPILIGTGFLLKGKVSNPLMIFIFILILTIGFLLEEILYAKHKKVMEERRAQAKAKRDMLKTRKLEDSLEKQKQDQQSQNKKNKNKKVEK